jgi:hypothetical protein
MSYNLRIEPRNLLILSGANGKLLSKFSIRSGQYVRRKMLKYQQP